MEPSRGHEEAKRRKIEAPNGEGSLVTSDTMDLKALLDQHSEQIRFMQSQIEGLVAINSTLAKAQLDEIQDGSIAQEIQAESQAQEVDELRERCDVLESRCGSLERSIQVLRKDVSWSYSAPDIPRSYWVEQGHDEQYAHNLEILLSRIKEDAEDIRDGRVYECACMCNDDGPTILHDDAMLPHFKELADAIQVSDAIGKIGYTSIEFSINNVELHPSALKILLPAMENKVTYIGMVDITFPHLLGHCYDIIASSIRRNHTLENLYWSGNELSSDMEADLLIESIIDNRTIKSVSLQECFNQEGVDSCRALTSLMTSGRSFERLVFSGNGLSGIDDVSTTALATDPYLNTFDIHGNDLNDRDAELIAQALKYNTNLQRMTLRGNSITRAGFERLRASIYNPSSFEAMESCNHTCWVDCVEGNDYGMTPRKRRIRKMYELLSTRHVEGSNACHLNAEFGEVMKLVPSVLKCVKQCSNDRTTDSVIPLSIYFELIKSWMPTIFGYH